LIVDVVIETLLGRLVSSWRPKCSPRR